MLGGWKLSLYKMQQFSFRIRFERWKKRFMKKRSWNHDVALVRGELLDESSLDLIWEQSEIKIRFESWRRWFMILTVMGSWLSDERRRRTETGTWDLLDWYGWMECGFVSSVPGRFHYRWKRNKKEIYRFLETGRVEFFVLLTEKEEKDILAKEQLCVAAITYNIPTTVTATING